MKNAPFPASIFAKKICVVTGAGSGIGRALVLALLRCGACVFAADIRADALRQLRREATAQKARLVTQKTDVTRAAQVRALVALANKRGGRVDFLFNNAGVGATMPTENATLSDWEKVINLDLWSVIYGTHAALPLMLAQESGHIVNTASIVGALAYPYQALYCAAKSAVVGLTRSMAYEFKTRRIYFSAVCPANVATGIFGAALDGTRAHVAPPPDAISVETATAALLAGVAARAELIFIPPRAKRTYAHYARDSKQWRAHVANAAAKRRKSFAKNGTYY